MAGFGTSDKGGGVPGTTMYADNVDFTGVTRTNTITTNGQLIIGSTAPNAGNNHINIGTITSPDGSMTIGYSSPNITISVTPSGPIMQTLTDDVGTLVTPISNNIQLQGHVVEQGATKFSTVVAGTHLMKINPMSSSRWIVDPLGFNGTHTTISSAITSATSGDTIFLLPGVYTENLTLKAGVNITAYESDGLTPTVTIIGNCTLTTAGTVTLSGLRLQTNSNFIISVTGSAASILNISNCYLNMTNNTGITFSSSSGSSQLNIDRCKGDLGTTGIAIYSMSALGSFNINRTTITNSGLSTTASNNSTATMMIQFSYFFSPFTTSGTGNFIIQWSEIYCSALNVTCITTAGSGDNNGCHYCQLFSGSASALSIGTGTVWTTFFGQFASTNTNAITGAGNINYGYLHFNQSSNAINTTTQTPQVGRYGILRSDQQPGFCAYASGNINNVTGDGTAYTVLFDTKVYDHGTNYATGTGLFTAPYTGVYLFSSNIYCTGMATGHTPIIIAIVTSTGTPTTAQTSTLTPRTAVTTNNQVGVTGMFLMNAGDTVQIVLTISGSTKTADISGGSDLRSSFCGWLLG